MALEFKIPFPIFAPSPTTTTQANRPLSEVRLSRWNNANAEPFIRRQREQKEIEDEIRRHRRFEAATNITSNYDSATVVVAADTFKSTGTPSLPSKPSIPGRISKYSKDPNHKFSQPVFDKIKRIRKIGRNEVERQTPKPGVGVNDDGVSYKVEGVPFDVRYSYTETPKVKPLKLREPPFSPFGPETMSRPWTGRKPFPSSNEKLKEIKEDVMPIRSPGPFLPGSGPSYVKSREDILGEPVSVQEAKEMVQRCLKSSRQINMGRDGLTHNMLDNIHAHWKRGRVCKIKCIGVCTVDMDNVKQQLEEKTGGKVIYSKGGRVYLFRGRDYNYRFRTRVPIMLWKPVSPVYPRLIQRLPEGLSFEEATEMRRRGRNLIPICKLGKNGFYGDLVSNVREAFEVCELVRINCKGMNGRDYRKIGGKLKDLVPCVLISFAHEHILMWRGRNWKSTFPIVEESGAATSDTSCISDPADKDSSSDRSNSIVDSLCFEDDEDSNFFPGFEIVNRSMSSGVSEDGDWTRSKSLSDRRSDIIHDHRGVLTVDSSPRTYGMILQEVSGGSYNVDGLRKMQSPEGILFLWKKALESGHAMVLDSSALDADIVYEKTVSFVQSAPPAVGTVSRPRKMAIQETDCLEVEGFR